jgi:hypothetical protein
MFSVQSISESELKIFSFCDDFFGRTGKVPTSRDILKECGGGKKEVLSSQRKWEALQLLGGGTEIPTEWMSWVAGLYTETQKIVGKRYEKQEAEHLRRIYELEKEVALLKKGSDRP